MFFCIVGEVEVVPWVAEERDSSSTMAGEGRVTRAVVTVVTGLVVALRRVAPETGVDPSVVPFPLRQLTVAPPSEEDPFLVMEGSWEDEDSPSPPPLLLPRRSALSRIWMSFNSSGSSDPPSPGPAVSCLYKVVTQKKETRTSRLESSLSRWEWRQKFISKFQETNCFLD